MEKAVLAKSLLASGLALALVACGGGSNARPDPAPTSPPPVSPPPPPPTSPPPPPPPQPAFDAHLALTNAKSTGYTGAGYRIGVVDSGVNRNHPALAGRVMANYNYIDPRRNNTAVDDVVGHGTAVAQLAAGAAVGQWPGGIAPGAEILSARIISDTPPEDDGSGDGNEVNGALGLASIHQDLIDAGMRIMNNSWGGLYWTNPNATAPIAAEYRPFIANHDGLVVFATGNEGKANPSDMASLPSQQGPNGSRPAADLERGWLAVAALDTANPTQLAHYSNACGVAMNYCLVAPGTAVFVGHDSTAGNLEYYYNSGTSFAAPQVSGAAALVWEAFPYFTNDLVRQTLLGTATDLGDPGVDAVFGYGLLNVGKAVRGPARLDFGDVSINLASGSSTWSNDLSGAGGLFKRGNGTLTLAGTDNANTGASRVEAGTLAVASHGTGTAYVDAGARLLASGTLKGGVDNAGTFELAPASGVVTQVGGDYLQRAGGVLAMHAGDQLQVGGSAELRGGDLHVLGKRDYVSFGQGYTLISADGGVSGQFARITAPSTMFIDASLAYSANVVELTLNRLDVTVAAASLGDITPATLASAGRVENAFRQIDVQQGQGEGAMVDGLIRAAGEIQSVATAAAATAVLESLSGQAHAAASAMTFDSIDMNRRALSAQFGERAQAALPAGGAWMRSLGGGGQGGYAGSDFEVGGWMMGSDTRLGSSGVLGFAFGETRATSPAGTALDRGRDRQTQAQLYAGWDLGDGYVLGQAGLGRYDRRIDRGLLLGSDRHGVHAGYAGDFVAASAEAGYRFGGAGFGITPYLGAEHARVQGDGFSEQGGYGFGLRTGAWSSSRTQALAGVRGEYRWQGVSFNGYAEWQQALASDGLAIDASFVGVEAWTPLAGLQPQRSGGLFGVSVDSWLSRNSKLSLGYDQRFGPRGDNRMASLRYWYGF